MKKFLLFIPVFLGCFFLVSGQKLVKLAKKGKVSFRGLSVINDECFWVSGTKGTIGIKVPHQKKIKWIKVDGFENRDFRDIEAFNDSTAVIMAIGEPALILRTTNAGNSWNTVYEKSGSGMFLDALTFNGEHGYCIGDPIDGRFWILESFDAGQSWEELALLLRPEALEGEALFAASGSNIQILPPDSSSKWRRPEPFTWGFVTGGKASRLFLMCENPLRPPVIVPLPLLQGETTTGANAWAINGNQWVVIGGDFKSKNQVKENHFYTVDEGKNWSPLPAGGYKSSICWLNDSLMIACGTSGVAFGSLSNENWKTIGKKPFHVVQKAKLGQTIILAGPKGRVYGLKL